MVTLIPALGSCVARKRMRGGTAIGCGRDGEAPLIIRLPTLREEVAQVTELLATAHREGHAWADMAILCRHHSEMDMCVSVVAQ